MSRTPAASRGAARARSRASRAQITEPADNPPERQLLPAASRDPPGSRWSYAEGPSPGIRCTVVVEPAGPDTWSDNFLRARRLASGISRGRRPGAVRACSARSGRQPPTPHLERQLPLLVGPRAARDSCPSRPRQIVAHCPAEPSCESYAGGFAWSFARGRCRGWSARIVEPADGHTWGDNYFCAARHRRPLVQRGAPSRGCAARRSSGPPTPTPGTTTSSASRRGRPSKLDYAGRLPASAVRPVERARRPTPWRRQLPLRDPARRGPPPGLMIGITPPGVDVLRAALRPRVLRGRRGGRGTLGPCRVGHAPRTPPCPGLREASRPRAWPCPCSRLPDRSLQPPPHVARHPRLRHAGPPR